MCPSRELQFFAVSAPAAARLLRSPVSICSQSADVDSCFLDPRGPHVTAVGLGRSSQLGPGSGPQDLRTPHLCLLTSVANDHTVSNMADGLQHVRVGRVFDGYRSGQRVSAPLKNLISSRAGQHYLLSPALIRQAQWTPSSHDDQGSGTVKLLSDTAHFTSAKFQTEAMMIWGCITVQPSSPRPSVDHFTPFKHNPTIAFSLSLLVEKRVVCTLGREREKKKNIKWRPNLCTISPAATGKRYDYDRAVANMAVPRPQPTQAEEELSERHSQQIGEGKVLYGCSLFPLAHHFDPFLEPPGKNKRLSDGGLDQSISRQAWQIISDNNMTLETP
ncbi:hypothetical protein RRG08_031358 [Elysia crispata]|uniref:Uncharacterized protein n=1 Tax=Elysia crispata TaxID=231223 RepID=A0AAE0YJD2_9GAST|nr:hypothetical protein RRG08_031358 [Elysia crispata]